MLRWSRCRHRSPPLDLRPDGGVRFVPNWWI